MTYVKQAAWSLETRLAKTAGYYPLHDNCTTHVSAGEYHK